MLTDYFLYAFGSLKHKRLRSWLTMLGIFIGIASVVALMGLGEGLRGAITGQFGFLGPDILSVQASGLNFAGPPGQAVVNSLTDDFADFIIGLEKSTPIIFPVLPVLLEDIIESRPAPQPRSRTVSPGSISAKIETLETPVKAFKLLFGMPFNISSV